jgi:quercetin dioxygenase-like cupin family protein
MRYDYPHTIENGGGESLTFLRRTTDDRGELLEVENVVKPGSGPPMHVHHRQEESLTVVSGTLGWERADGSKGTAGPGESMVFEPGDAHRFWNAGDDELRCKGYIRPPDNIEYFLAGVYDSIKRHGGKRPGAIDIAFLESRYRPEFETKIIPTPVKRVLFPILIAIGRVTGKLERYADAPEPIPRGS